MVKPMATQPSRAASFTLPVTAEQGGWPLDSVSLSLSFKMSGICPAYFPATASRNPSGAAYALQPASMASWMWYSGSYPAGFGANERAGPCSNPWSTGRMTIFPEPASRPWLSIRARFVLVPGLSEGYQLRISRTRAVNSMSASRIEWGNLSAASAGVQGIRAALSTSRLPEGVGWRCCSAQVGARPSGRPGWRREQWSRVRPRSTVNFPRAFRYAAAEVGNGRGLHGSLRDSAVRPGGPRAGPVLRPHQVLPHQFRTADPARLLRRVRGEGERGPRHRAEEAALEFRAPRLGAHPALDRLRDRHDRGSRSGSRNPARLAHRGPGPGRVAGRRRRLVRELPALRGLLRARLRAGPPGRGSGPVPRRPRATLRPQLRRGPGPLASRHRRYWSTSSASSAIFSRLRNSGVSSRRAPRTTSRSRSITSELSRVAFDKDSSRRTRPASQAARPRSSAFCVHSRAGIGAASSGSKASTASRIPSR